MSSGFITENEAIEIRQKRQDEWERVRTAEDPIERPQEFDHRCLYDRLQENKQKKDLEYEEAHKLKNMIKGLDDDEVDFLDYVDRSKLAADRKKVLEEESEINDFRTRVATLQEKTHDQKLQNEIKNNKRKLSSEINKVAPKKGFMGVVVKKPTKVEDHEEVEEKKRKLEVASKSSPALKCVGILPGLGDYSDSSSDESSSNSDSDDEAIKALMRSREILERKVELLREKMQNH